MFNKPLTTLVVLLGLSTTAHAAREALPPEQIFDLYAKVLLNQDADSARTLNDYMRPAYENQDHLDVESLKQGLAEMRATMVHSFLQEIPAKQRAAVKPSLESLFAGMQGLMNKAECKAVGSTVQENEYVKDNFVAEVNYRCTVSAVTLDLASLVPEGKAKRKFDAKKFNAAVREMTDRIDSETGTRTIDGTTSFYADAEKRYWSNGSIGEVVGTVMGAFEAE